MIVELQNRPGSKVPVPRKTLNSWKRQYKFGIIKEIAEAKNLNRNTVSDAFAGIAQPEVIEAINEFFNSQKRNAA